MAERNVKLFSNNVMAAAFALVNFVLLVLLLWTVTAEYAPGFHCNFLNFLRHLPSEMVTRTGFSFFIPCSEWKKYQREYYELYAERVKDDDPELTQKLLATPLEIQQVWTPKLGITDRCMTCHMGVENPEMKDAPQPYTFHPDMTPHKFSDIGCAVCHEGQSRATNVQGAHVMPLEELEGRFGPYEVQHSGWERPLLPLQHVQASCQKCHNVMEAPIPGADHLNAGWQLVQEKGCKTCHYVVDSGAKQAPELSIVGTKWYNEGGHSEAFYEVRFGYLKESLRCPQANVDHAAEERCKAELTPTSANGGAALSGAELVQKYQCKNCHNFTAPIKILGPSLYDVGKRKDEAYIRESIVDPDKVVVTGFPAAVMKATLSGFGFYKDVEANPAIVESLVSYLASLQGGDATAGGEPTGAAQAAPVLLMPNFNLKDEELRDVVTFLLSLQEHEVQWPQKSFAQKDGAEAQASGGGIAFRGKSGEELVKLAGCVTCHKLDGPERLVGPSLWDIGARQDNAYIRESILEPNKVVVQGFPPAVMKQTLLGTGFYQQVSLEALEKIVDYLAGLKGKS